MDVETEPVLEESLLVDDSSFMDPTMSVIKNSTIPVNVDDLGPGLIIATYIHSNGSLYQGVLLQLNRERGIPCGISFPKDYCSTIPSKSSEFENENEQAPIEQRHTYFQGDPNAPPKLLRRFNRATKPPARYKNGRLAIRLRHRPVLCSKCKAYCEEKNSPSPKVSVENGDPLKGSGVTTRRTNLTKYSYPKEEDTLPLVIETNSNGSSNVSEEPEDFAFSVAGPVSGVVENYWKRPTPNEPEKSRHSGKTDEKGTAKPTTADNTFKSFLSLKIVENNQVTSSTLIAQSENEDDPPPTAELQAKKQNLRFCINKLRIRKQSILAQENEISESFVGEVAAATEDSTSIHSVFHSPVTRRTTRDKTSTAGNSKTRKRSSTVPARFRDATSITKNIPDFKRRRQGNKSLGMDISRGGLLTTPQVQPSSPIGSEEAEKREFPSGSDISATTPCRKISSTRMSKISSLTPKGEVSRTPTIKISFGSSGKGVVLEIPSKPTAESSPEDSASPFKSRAEKRALRKARKQAKRKLSKDTEESEPRSSSLNENALSYQEFSSSQSSCSSPPPPLLTPISEFCPSVVDEEFAVSLDHCPPLIHFNKEMPYPFPLTPKKRKKEKKHKKDKVRKEEKTSS